MLFRQSWASACGSETSPGGHSATVRSFDPVHPLPQRKNPGSVGVPGTLPGPQLLAPLTAGELHSLLEPELLTPRPRLCPGIAGLKLGSPSRDTGRPLNSHFSSVQSYYSILPKAFLFPAKHSCFCKLESTNWRLWATFNLKMCFAWFVVLEKY